MVKAWELVPFDTMQMFIIVLFLFSLADLSEALIIVVERAL